MSKHYSPFLQATTKSQPKDLAIVHLSRDSFAPIVLLDPSEHSQQSPVGPVLTTRFGIFPHSTLTGVPWGSQIRASNVNTGAWRKKKARQNGAEEDGTKDDSPAGTDDTNAAGNPSGKKRKRPFEDPNDASDSTRNGLPSEPDSREVTVAPESNTDSISTPAASGFVHLLKPTPELWTMSLPHRTQVVYTPDYSYILQRIRAFPGSRLIESGAGSGSFTHASARAVFNGYPKDEHDQRGKVFSFEFHETRFKRLVVEIEKHGLSDIVQITHRDVYGDGFLVNGESPKASAIFLDLPAPWDALPHLCRRRPKAGTNSNARTPNSTSEAAKLEAEDEIKPEPASDWVSPLDPTRTVHICTFSPCIEQVVRTIEVMRTLGWKEIEMVEISNRRIQVVRDRQDRGQTLDRGMQQPADVDEAVARLAMINKRTQEYHESGHKLPSGESRVSSDKDVEMAEDNGDEEFEDAPVRQWMTDGKLTHRLEPEVKTHTSYLLFAILPREWTEEDEAAAMAAWPVTTTKGIVGTDRKSRKEAARAIHDKKKKKNAQPLTEGGTPAA